MIEWSCAGLLHIFRVGIPIIGMSVLLHLFVFLIFGLPLFFLFWARRSVVWALPVSLPLGLILGACVGFPYYSSGGSLSNQGLVLSLGYGGVTAIGCWVANRRSEQDAPSDGDKHSV
jgi:hypothetical protein